MDISTVQFRSATVHFWSTFPQYISTVPLHSTYMCEEALSYTTEVWGAGIDLCFEIFEETTTKQEDLVDIGEDGFQALLGEHLRTLLCLLYITLKITKK